jgi:hypothetical protein
MSFLISSRRMGPSHDQLCTDVLMTAFSPIPQSQISFFITFINRFIFVYSLVNVGTWITKDNRSAPDNKRTAASD